MRRGRLSRRKGRGLALGLLLIGAFLAVVLLTGPRLRRLPPADAAAAVDTQPDLAMAPLESAEGAVGVVRRPNAGSAVNPVTPTGELGGPAGQTPAWGEPGGVPSRVVRP